MNFQPLSIKPNNLRLQQPHFCHLSTAATVRILLILMKLRVFQFPFYLLCVVANPLCGKGGFWLFLMGPMELMGVLLFL